MKEQKNIDRLFQERLKDLETAPPDAAWDHIASQLDQNDDRPVLLPLWIKFAGIAAVGIAIISVIFYSNDDQFLDPAKRDVPMVNESITAPVNNGLVDDGPKNTQPEVITSSPAQVDTSQQEKSSKEITAGQPSQELSNIKQVGGNKTNSAGSRVKSRNSLNSADAIANSESQASLKKPTANSLLNDPGVDEKEGDHTAATSSNTDTRNRSKSVENAIAASTSTSANGRSTVNKENTATTASNNLLTSLEETVDNKAAQKTKPLEDAVATLIETQETITDTVPLQRWTAATVIAPIYTSNFTGSSVNNQVPQNNQDAQTDLSYGLALTYNLNKRWSVRTGLHQVQMNYVNDNVNYGLNPSNFSIDDNRINAVYDASAVSAQRDAPFARPSSFDQELQRATILSSFKGDLNQRLGYLEVPLEIKYRLLDKRIGISLLGGFSALFLTENQVSIEDNGRRLDLGTDENFQDFNQSANLGLGLDYQFTKNIGLSIEPTFKYQLNALRDDTSNFRPYTIGVYTGLLYRF